MSGEAPLNSPAEDLACGFAAHVLAWASRMGAAAETLAVLDDAAQKLCLAVDEGHVCLPLASLVEADKVAALRRHLLDSGVLAVAPVRLEHSGAFQVAPLLLDAADRLYLRRHYVWEQRLAAALLRLLTNVAPFLDEAAVLSGLRQQFPQGAWVNGKLDWQMLAVALALRQRLMIISGGPGTGKTTTVAALLACLYAAQDAGAPPLRVVLAAPTGKAAARMLEALQDRARNWPEALQAQLPQQAFTLHRLLGVKPRNRGFRHHAGKRLGLDVLVVDEASMLDLGMATRLLDALPQHVRLILLGDKGQLSAVGAGSVFAALSSAFSLSEAAQAYLSAVTGVETKQLHAELNPNSEPGPGPLRDHVLWLRRSYRFSDESGIGRLAAAINGGEGKAAIRWLRQGNDEEVCWLQESVQEDSGRSAELLASLRRGYAPYVTALADFLRAQRAEEAAVIDPAEVFAAFDRFRVLCTVYDGARGVDALNAWLEADIRRQLGEAMDDTAAKAWFAPDQAQAWYPGRAIIVLRNDALSGLFNGDVGLCLPDCNAHPLIWFAGGGKDKQQWRCFTPLRLPAHDSAFAMTVHKSQGSEFDEVLVVLPSIVNRVLTRELLYTGITRARKRVTLAMDEAVFEAACASPTLRYCGLGDRLHELWAGGDAVGGQHS